MRKNNLTQCLRELAKELAIPICLGIAGGLWASAETDKYLLNKYLEMPKAEFIDRDERVDLIIDNRIYLSEPNGEYRRIQNSDIYRIK